MNSRWGYRWRALHEDEEAARALGVPALRSKIFVVAISAGLAGIGGGLMGLMQGSLFPDSIMGLRLSIEVLIAPIIGGLGSLFGPIVGAFFVVPMMEASNVLGQSTGSVRAQHPDLRRRNPASSRSCRRASGRASCASDGKASRDDACGPQSHQGVPRSGRGERRKLRCPRRRNPRRDRPERCRQDHLLQPDRGRAQADSGSVSFKGEFWPDCAREDCAARSFAPSRSCGRCAA